MTTPHFTIDIWHNILWSAYKGEVFSALHERTQGTDLDIRFFQIAETEGNRIGLSGVDLGRHRYPYDLLFKGTYNGAGFLNRAKEIAKRTWDSNADLFILTGYEKPEVWIQLALIKLRRKKVAFFCDSALFDQPQNVIKGTMKRLIFSLADGFFGYGQRNKEYVVHYGAAPEKFHLRCQAAALPYDYARDKAFADRLRLAPTPDAPRFLFVGRLSPEKNLPGLLDAFARVQQTIPSASLVIIGSGPLKEELEAKARSLGLDPSAIFLGSKTGPALYEEFGRATALILLSHSETWGLVVNEALHYGCPAIVSERCGCARYLIAEGVTGFVHDAFDVNDLAAKMLAAPAQFADIHKTAQDCLAQIENFTPARAAVQIMDGCHAILTTKGS